MNSYFASVEQQANPFLRGKPLGVCAYLSERGCIIAASVEAKKSNVKVGMRVYEARSVCSNISFVQNDPVKYRSTTERIFSIFRDYTDTMEPYSIDEAFLKLEEVGVINVAEEIKRRIKDEVGEWLRCSIGIAPTRWLAKFSSDLKKPDGLVLLNKEDLERVFKQLPATEAWGIGDALGKRLFQLGIVTIDDLRQYPVANLMQKFGVNGYYLWANVNGVELPSQPARCKSIGHSYCLPRKTNDRVYLDGILAKLCERAGRRLRQDGREAWGIYCAWRYVGGGHLAQSESLKTPLWGSWKIFQAAKKIILFNNEKVDFLAVSLMRLRERSAQLFLFDSDISEKNEQLVMAMDKINDKYGDNAIICGVKWGMEKYAPERIGFRKIG